MRTVQRLFDRCRPDQGTLAVGNACPHSLIIVARVRTPVFSPPRGHVSRHRAALLCRLQYSMFLALGNRGLERVSRAEHHNVPGRIGLLNFLVLLMLRRRPAVGGLSLAMFGRLIRISVQFDVL